MDSHMVGFEREELFHKALFVCCQANEKFKARTLREALAITCPEFMVGLFEPRKCIRKLKYIGHDNWGKDALPDDSDSFFEYGKIYESVDFNGGTYQIQGIDGRMGCVYFEVC